MPGVTDYSDDELDEPDQALPLDVPHNASPEQESEPVNRQLFREPSRNTPEQESEPVNRQLFREPSRGDIFEPEPVPLDSENADNVTDEDEIVSAEPIDEYDWLDEADNSDNRLNEIMKEDVRVESDNNVKNLLIENIMSLIHNNVFRLVPMYLPRLESGELVLRPSVVDTKSVEHYLRNYKTTNVLELSILDEYKEDGIEMVFEKIHELLKYHNIDIDELID